MKQISFLSCAEYSLLLLEPFEDNLDFGGAKEFINLRGYFFILAN